MSTVVDHIPQGVEEGYSEDNYLRAGRSLRSWLLTQDHKRVAWLYLVSITLLFTVGAIGAAMVRYDLLAPDGLLDASTYNRAFSIHGIVMVFFFLVPSIPATLGNFAMPLMIGARDVAFPRLNLFSWYLYTTGAFFVVLVMLLGGVDTGWTFYTPYSTVYSNSAVAVSVLAVFSVGFSSILTGLNFMVTIHKMRAPGMTWFRMPLFVWAIYATSFIQLLGTPILGLAMLLIFLDHFLGIAIFNPALGGDPVLFQHLFWFYSHPAVYIMILPSMGVMSTVIPTFARNPVFGYKFIAMSTLAIAFVGFLVWGHHLFVTSQSVYAAIVFSLLSFMVSVPSAVKVFNWTATLYKGQITYESPMLYAFTFIGLFLIGGLTGVFLATLSADIVLHATYFVVGAVSGFLAGIHYWWPKMTGRMYPEIWARFAAILLFVGFNITFFPQLLLGVAGMPRRYATYTPDFQPLNVLSSAGSVVLGVGYLLPLGYLLWSLKYGRRAPDNPWEGARGFEWETSSPPPLHNFHKMPVLEREAHG
jgi:cytochrome c oxidase subunit 1